MDNFPTKLFSRAGRGSSERLKILKDPLKIFETQSRRFLPLKQVFFKEKIKLDITEIINSSAHTPRIRKKKTLSPTSSFLTPSRETFYNLYNKNSIAPDPTAYTPNFTYTYKHINSPRYALPMINKINNRLRDNLKGCSKS